ncbi:hypothetical protein GCM10023149_02570 [Mucilaginibacter gynuensis]|uniref:Tetratricopeptide repeat protein n=1 Tax=Mucilaginibacter gynuensis TaxID=1302236 RepID=A0ABP8FPY4_9SPHI
MQCRKFILLVLLPLFTTSLAFGQSEPLKVVVNYLGFYKEKKDLKYLAAAKKSIDSLVVTKKDSANLEKRVYQSLVYSTILNVDTLNQLNQPADFFPKTVDIVEKISANRRIRNHPEKLAFARQCIANYCIRRGFGYMNKSDFLNADTYFRMAQQYAPAYKPINAYIAYSNNKLGKLQDAARFYNNLVAADSMKAEYIQNAANINIAIGDTVKALEIIKKGRALMPGDKFLILDEANIYNNKKDYKALEPLLGNLLADNKNNPDILFVAANCYDHLNQYDKAEDYYLKAVDLNSTAFDPVFNLGLLYYRKSVTDKAEDDVLKNLYYAAKWLEKANEISPNDIKSLQILQHIYTQTGNTKQLNKINSKIKQLTI